MKRDLPVHDKFIKCALIVGHAISPIQTHTKYRYIFESEELQKQPVHSSKKIESYNLICHLFLSLVNLVQECCQRLLLESSGLIDIGDILPNFGNNILLVLVETVINLQGNK